MSEESDMAGRELFIAHTHRDWFDFLSRHATDGRVDEVNFWFPKQQRAPKRLLPGEPVFFRIGAPERKIAGYGFFASFQLLPLDLAWDSFGYRNGAVDRSSFYRMLRSPRQLRVEREGANASPTRDRCKTNARQLARAPATRTWRTFSTSSCSIRANSSGCSARSPGTSRT